MQSVLFNQYTGSLVVLKHIVYAIKVSISTFYNITFHISSPKNVLETILQGYFKMTAELSGREASCLVISCPIYPSLLYILLKYQIYCHT